MTASTDDFFRSRLDQLIDLRHPLAVLANRRPWHEIEASLAHRFARRVRTGKQVEDLGLFGPTVSVAGTVVSNTGRPRFPTRLMISLLSRDFPSAESVEMSFDFCGGHFLGRMASAVP
jgi:IS5 family transposase